MQSVITQQKQQLQYQQMQMDQLKSSNSTKVQSNLDKEEVKKAMEGII